MTRHLCDPTEPRAEQRTAHVPPVPRGGFHKAGTTILLVEQNAQMALSVADRAYVLETGKIVSTGTGAQLLNDESVKKAYLGG